MALVPPQENYTHPSKKSRVRIFHLKSFEIYLHYVTIRKKSVEIEVAHTRKKLNQIIKPVIQKILGEIKTHYQTILIDMDQILIVLMKMNTLKRLMNFSKTDQITK